LLHSFLEKYGAIEHKWTILETYTTKMFGGSTGEAILGKRASDAAIAYACEDGVCFIVSCVGCGFDALQFLASFVSGLNITSLITLPGSLCCKTFVWACKNQTFPWKKECN
jgi:hypothetical protein